MVEYLNIYNAFFPASPERTTDDGSQVQARKTRQKTQHVHHIINYNLRQKTQDAWVK